MPCDPPHSPTKHFGSRQEKARWVLLHPRQPKGICSNGTLRELPVAHFTCTKAVITDSGAAPVLVLRCQLLGAGLDPDRALEVYRVSTTAPRTRD